MDGFALLRPALQALDPETAHRLTVRGLSSGLVRGPSMDLPSVLSIRTLGLDFKSPIGLAAGFDKNAETMAAMASFGFGSLEVGTVTPRPQAGNPRPRLFRLPEDQAVINRFGFNNDGGEMVERRLKAYRDRYPVASAGQAASGPILGVNIGANKETEDRIADYVAGVERFEALADYLTVNISSPNTPGLRDLQSLESLKELLARLRPVRRTHKPVFVKIAPDIVDEDLPGIVDAALEYGAAGLIISNTTIARPPLKATARKEEAGGLSGKPLFQRSSELLRQAYAHAPGRLTLIGVGGVSSGGDAYAKIRAGASLVQLYTALAYRGPKLIQDIHRELAHLLRRDGFAHVGEAVGADMR